MASFQPTVANTRIPRVTAEGMVWIPGGEFSMGAAESPGMNMVGMEATTDSRPIHRVYVDGFWMDKTEVTNAQFAKFVEATGYVTIAERAPRAEDFPGAPPENLVAGAVVFSPPGHPVPLNDHFQWWSYVKRANWRHPEGPDSSIAGREQYPVVQVAYDDAVAFAKWAGKRLPTEAEWEFAARGGLSGKLYAWGDEFRRAGTRWPTRFRVTSRTVNRRGRLQRHRPGDAVRPNGYGLYDVAGNVWEWTSDWYRPDYYAQLASAGGVARNPRGPETPFDPRSRPRRSGFTVAGRSCAQTGTVHATWWKRRQGRSSTGRIHVASASKRRRDVTNGSRRGSSLGHVDRMILLTRGALVNLRTGEVVADACGGRLCHDIMLWWHSVGAQARVCAALRVQRAEDEWEWETWRRGEANAGRSCASDIVGPTPPAA